MVTTTSSPAAAASAAVAARTVAELGDQVGEGLGPSAVSQHDVVAAREREPRDGAADVSAADDADGGHVVANGPGASGYSAAYVDTVSAMRLRLQLLGRDGARVRVALKPTPDSAWTLEEISGSAVAGRYMQRAGIEDVRDWAELEQQARAAHREWGPEGGFEEWTPQRGTRRFSGDLLQVVSD